MNPNARNAVLVVIIIAILAALALSFPTPLLYTLEQDSFASQFHENVDALKIQSQNSTTDVAPLIQDFIDFSGPVSLNIRIHDIEQARRDLERFDRSHGSIKNLIIRLDMNESQIQEIEKNTALQKEILESLMNTSATLDSLQMMEIQYHSQNNQDMLTTIRLQGDTIRKKVRGLDERYRNATEKIVESGKKFGLNITQSEESQKQVEQIVREIEQPKAETQLAVDTSLVPGDDRVSLFIRPDTGKYLDTIEYMGISLTLKGNTTLRAEGKPITLYMDDQQVKTVDTDAFGYYTTKIPIERIAAGTHTVYSRSTTSRSVNRTLTVSQVDSVTNLTISAPDRDGNVNCTGSVMANQPVRSASVQLVWDKTHITITKTNAEGLFMKEIRLPVGRHTVTAGFTGDGLPINPSESEPQVVEISLIQSIESETGGLTIFVAIIVVFFLFLAAAAFYLNRMTRKKIPPAGIPGDMVDSADENSPSIMDGITPDYPARPANPVMISGETLIEFYTRVLNERGLSAASRIVYEHLAGILARDLGIKRHRTLTAREMSRNCRGKPYCGAFSRFTAIYERVRYGGRVSVRDQAIFEAAIDSADDLMEGEHH